MQNPWKTISSKTLLENPWWEVRQDQIVRPDGSPGEYNIVVTTDSAFAVTITEKNEFILIEQFRYISGKLSLEIPGGAIDHDDPLDSAKRELREETGITAATWTDLGAVLPANGLVREKMHVFIAQDLDFTHEVPEQDEAISRVLHISFPEVLELIKTNKLDDGQSITGIFMAALHLKLLG